MTDIAHAQTPAQTRAEQQRARLDAMVEQLDKRKDQLATLLHDAGIQAKQFTEVFRRALMKDPDLLSCDAGSLIQACVDAATDGLLPDGRQAVILARNVNIAPRGQPKQWAKKANYQAMYQGLLAVAYRSGNFRKIEARVVYDGDDFDYELGDRPSIRHKPAKRQAQRGENPLATARPIVNAYAIAETVNGGIFREVLEEDDIRKINAVSKASSGPGKDWPEEMARKGAVRRIWKYLPKTPAMERILDHVEQVFDVDAEAEEVPPPKRIMAGFQPRLAHNAGAPMDIIAPEVRVEEDGPIEHVVAGGGDRADERAARMVGDLPDQEPSSEPIDEEFPGDRAAAESPLPVGADFDLMAWADEFNGRLVGFQTVAEVTAAWNDAKSRGITAKLQHADLDRFDELVDARERRVDAIRATR